MNDIDIYNNSKLIIESKMPKRVISWVIILIVLSCLLIILFSISFNIYKSYFGEIIKEDNNFYLNLYLDESDFPISKKSSIYIKDKKYDYRIIDINDGILRLEVDLDDEILIANNMVTVNVVSKRTTILKLVLSKIKKGLGI